MSKTTYVLGNANEKANLSSLKSIAYEEVNSIISTFEAENRPFVGLIFIADDIFMSLTYSVFMLKRNVTLKGDRTDRCTENKA